MVRLFALVCSIVVITLFSSLGFSATFETSVWYGRRAHITMWGEIKMGDDLAFKREILSQIRAGYLVTTISLYTPGGSVDAAMKMGEQIRLLHMQTQSPFKSSSGELVCHTGSFDRLINHTDSRCECASACFIVWAGGVGRFGNYVGIHHPYFNPKMFGKLDPEEAEKMYGPVETETRTYFAKMGVGDAIVNKMLRILSKDMVYLNEDQLDSLRNPASWIDEQVLARCGEIPDGLYYSNPARKAYLDCASAIHEAVYRKSAQKYLDVYGEPGEKVPLAAVPATPVAPPSLRPAPTPAPIKPTSPSPVQPPGLVVAPSIPGTKVVSTSGPNAEYFVRDNRDLDGIDIKPYLKNIDQNSCALACTANPFCQGYNYDEWNRFCILKSSVSASRLDPKSISAVKKILGPFPKPVDDLAKMYRYLKAYFPGDGYGNLTAYDANACSETCRTDLSCVAFTFFKSSQQCRLFKSTGQYTRGSDATESGVKSQTN